MPTIQRDFSPMQVEIHTKRGYMLHHDFFGPLLNWCETRLAKRKSGCRLDESKYETLIGSRYFWAYPHRPNFPLRLREKYGRHHYSIHRDLIVNPLNFRIKDPTLLVTLVLRDIERLPL